MSMPPFRTYYDVLEVAESASQEEIARAYKALVRQFHPDQIPDHLTRVRQDATERLKELNAAWEVLGNSQARAVYDKKLAALRARTRASSQSRRTASPPRPPTPPPPGPSPAASPVGPSASAPLGGVGKTQSVYERRKRRARYAAIFYFGFLIHPLVWFTAWKLLIGAGRITWNDLGFAPILALIPAVNTLATFGLLTNSDGESMGLAWTLFGFWSLPGFVIYVLLRFSGPRGRSNSASSSASSSGPTTGSSRGRLHGALRALGLLKGG